MKVRWKQAELAGLAELRDQDTITEEAYQAKKKPARGLVRLRRDQIAPHLLRQVEILPRLWLQTRELFGKSILRSSKC